MILAYLISERIIYESDTGLFDFPIPPHSVKAERDVMLMIDGYTNIPRNC